MLQTNIASIMYTMICINWFLILKNILFSMFTLKMTHFQQKYAETPVDAWLPSVLYNTRWRIEKWKVKKNEVKNDYLSNKISKFQKAKKKSLWTNLTLKIKCRAKLRILIITKIKFLDIWHCILFSTWSILYFIHFILHPIWNLNLRDRPFFTSSIFHFIHFSIHPSLCFIHYSIRPCTSLI